MAANARTEDARTEDADSDEDFAAINQNPVVVNNLLGSRVIDRCSICRMQIFTSTEQHRHQWPVCPVMCGHLFHQFCLAKWVRYNKPITGHYRKEYNGRYLKVSWPTRCPRCNREFHTFVVVNHPGPGIDFSGISGTDV